MSDPHSKKKTGEPVAAHTSPVTNSEWALFYAEHGFRVFPCHNPVDDGCSCGKDDCKSPAKHPRTKHGVHDATTNREKIGNWWSQTPEANIGLATGAESGIVAVDLDTYKNPKLLQNLEDELSRTGDTPEQTTPRGGQHLLFRHPGFEVKNASNLRRNRLGEGLDIRGDGGYILVHPSRGVNNRQYEWDTSATLGDAELADCPAWLLDWIGNGHTTANVPSEASPPPTPNGNGSKIVAHNPGAIGAAVSAMLSITMDDGADGSKRLYSYACRAIEHGLSDDEGVAAVRLCANLRPFPRDYSDEAITKRLRDAEKSVSCLVPKTSSCQETKLLDPIPVSKLSGSFQVDWVWVGFLTKDSVSALVGLWKAGKTTLLANLLREFEAGGDLAGNVIKGRVLVVTEESESDWKTRCAELGIGDHVEFLSRPFMMRPSWREWDTHTLQLAELVRERKYCLVVFDTWSSVSPCDDENDAASTTAALKPLHRITEAGAAVLLMHHPRKGDASEGQASRGSGALPAFVDTLIELRRFNPEQADDTRRVLRTYSRYSQVEAVIELTPDGFRHIGTKADATKASRLCTIRDLLTEDSQTVQQITDLWPDNLPKPSSRSVRRDLRDGATQGMWRETGLGKKSDPFKYAVCVSFPDSTPS